MNCANCGRRIAVWKHGGKPPFNDPIWHHPDINLFPCHRPHSGHDNDDWRTNPAKRALPPAEAEMINLVHRATYG